MRQIILDTETTGLKVEDGHRLIEIGCIEMIDRRITDNYFHEYINPEREVEAGALAVHGISNAFLADKPTFGQIVDKFMAYIGQDELVIHNAPFDLSFLNHELMLTRRGFKTMTDYCRVVDTLQMARKIHVGQRNSLDALCKRYGVDNSKRELHGALVDCQLLAQVYLAMTGGQGSFFDALNPADDTEADNTNASFSAPLEKHTLVVLRATDAELTDHDAYLQLLQKKGKCLWQSDK